MSPFTLIALLVCALAATSYALPPNELHLLLQKMAGPKPSLSPKGPSPSPAPSATKTREQHQLKRLAEARARLGLTNPYKSTRPLSRPPPPTRPTDPSPTRYATRDQIKRLQEQAKKAMEAARLQSEKAERLNREAQMALKAVQGRGAGSPPPAAPTPVQRSLEALLPRGPSQYRNFYKKPYRMYPKYSIAHSRSLKRPTKSYKQPTKYYRSSSNQSKPNPYSSRSRLSGPNPYSRQNMISPANRVRASRVPGVSENSLAAKVLQLRATRMQMQAGKSRKATPLSQALAIRRAQAAGQAAVQKKKVDPVSNPYGVPKDPVSSVPSPKTSIAPTTNPYSKSRAATSDLAAVRDTAQQEQEQQNKIIAQRNMLIQRRRMALMNMAKKAKAKITAFKTIKKIQDQPKKDKEAMKVGCMPHPSVIPMGSCKDPSVKYTCGRHRMTRRMRPTCVDVGIKPMCCPRGTTAKSIQQVSNFQKMQKNMKHYQKMFEMIS